MKQTTKLMAWFFQSALFWLVCISSSLQAEEVVFDGNALSKFGTKTYKVTWIDRGPIVPVEHERGTMTFSAIVTKDMISLKNVTRMYLPDGKRFIKYDTNCSCSADGKLSLQKIDTKVARSDDIVLHSSQTLVEQDKISHKYHSDGKDTVIQEEWVKGTLIDIAVFFLIPQLSQKKDESVTIENVMISPNTSIRKTKSHTITCLGVDQSLSTDKQKLTKFVNTPKGEKPGITYWVDENGLLQRVLLNPDSRLDLVK
ncbi:MAG: hypothetical protein COA78_28785 [Blastopirellula sp.]|nr:MAG: hypothetical protein COA78_28785 [Blastopirellula sp.]